MNTTTNPTRRIRALVDAASWHLRGIVDTDSVRPVRFGLRDLWQRDEITRRVEWARTLRAESNALATLETAGFIADPFEGGLDLSGVCELGASLARDVKASNLSTKAFHVNHLLPRETEAIERMLAVALDDRLIRLATSYLGVVPVLGDMDFFCSLPTPEGIAFTKSQLYHCDDTSLSQLKYFVYCDDVGKDDGPLEVVDASRSKVVRDRIGYRYGGRACRVGDDTMSSQVGASDQHSFTGPRGTSFIVDTARCFHRGSRIRMSDRRRMVGVFQFVPPNCTQLPLRLRNGAPFARLAAEGMSPLERAVLGEPVT